MKGKLLQLDTGGDWFRHASKRERQASIALNEAAMPMLSIDAHHRQEDRSASARLRWRD